MILILSLALAQQATGETHVVERGETLWSIHKDHYKTDPTQKRIRVLAERNNITHEKLWVFPGRKIEVPKPLMKREVKEEKKDAEKVARQIQESAKKEKEEAKEEEVKTYKVRSGDTLWDIHKKFYEAKPTPNRVDALASWNDQVSDPKKMRVGQILEIPFPLVVEQRQVNANPTTLPEEEALPLSLKQLQVSAEEAGMDVSVPQGVAVKLQKALKETSATMRLNGKKFAVATFNKSAQGWTRVTAKEELSGSATMTRINKDYFLRVIKADQCDNFYLQLLMFVPPPPQAPPPPPKVAKAEVQERADKIYQQVTSKPKARLEVSGGGTWQDYTDGAEDYSDWIYASLLFDTGRYIGGKKLHLGPFFNHSGWDGTWKDPTKADPNTFYFEGDEQFYGPEARLTGTDREFIFRGGPIEQEAEGRKTDEWGTYREEEEYEGWRIQAGVEDWSRFDKRFLPKTKLMLGYTWQTDEETSASWTSSQTGSKEMLSKEADTIEGVDASLELDWAKDRQQYVTLSTELWGQALEDGDKVGKITPYIGFLGDSLKIGYQWTEADYHDSGHVSGDGLSWQVHLYDFYKWCKDRSQPIKAPQ
ncbi:MAG: LysM peptidoglycan-binding domain-containing protein [Patescibacteria group bacterium]